MHAGGQRFESVILHHLEVTQVTFFDILELIEVVIELIENYNEYDKLLRAHRECLGSERR